MFTEFRIASLSCEAFWKTECEALAMLDGGPIGGKLGDCAIGESAELVPPECRPEDEELAEPNGFPIEVLDRATTLLEGMVSCFDDLTAELVNVRVKYLTSSTSQMDIIMVACTGVC